MLSPPSQGNEFAQGFEIVGKNVKILVDAISDLREFDLSHVVELPELVLVGDQSAGKSSLMSALTEIQLPRDQGAISLMYTTTHVLINCKECAPDVQQT